MRIFHISVTLFFLAGALNSQNPAIDPKQAYSKESFLLLKPLLAQMAQDILAENPAQFKGIKSEQVETNIVFLEQENRFLIRWEIRHGVKQRMFTQEDFDRRKQMVDGVINTPPLATETTFAENGFWLNIFISYRFIRVSRTDSISLHVMNKGLEAGYYLDSNVEMKSLEQSIRQIMLKHFSKQFSEWKLHPDLKPEFDSDYLKRF
ncbi:MAG: hypothetical protein HC904_17360 [Blastochloris sp.]|nr:hypothetical protein [Blastochloris sp.]